MTQTFASEYPLYEFKTSPSLNTGYTNTNLNGNFTNPNKTSNTTVTQSKEQLLTAVKSKYQEQAITLARKLEKDLNSERQNMVSLKALMLELNREEMRLQDFEESAPKLMSDLENKIETIDQLLIAKQGTALNLESLESTIFPSDENSRYIMELVSSNKAIEELNVFAEELFRHGKVDLETYLKIYRDNIEREFNNNAWLKKLITGSCI